MARDEEVHRLPAKIAAKSACELEAQQCPHAVTEDCKWQIQLIAQCVRDLINQGSEPFDRRFTKPLLASRQLHSAKINVKRQVDGPSPKRLCASSCVWKAKQT
jgi:hypothetical protein